MKFFGNHPEASKKEIPEQFLDYMSKSSHPGRDILMFFNKAKKYSTEELKSQVLKEKSPYKQYGLLLELKYRDALSDTQLINRYKELENIAKDLKKYDKIPTPEEAITTTSLAATGAGLGMLGLQKAFYTSDEKVIDFVKGMATKSGVDPAKINVELSKDYGKLLPTIFGRNPGPHYQGVDFFGGKLETSTIRSTPNIAIAGHEMGHAINQEKFFKNSPKLKRLYNLAYQRLPLGPVKNIPIFGIPAAAAAMYAAKKRAEGKDAKFIPEWVEKNPETLVGAAAVPMLAEESIATGRAIKGISRHFKGLQKVKEIAKAVSTTAPALATYALGALVPIIGIKAYQKHVDAKNKLEKKYKYKKRKFFPDKQVKEGSVQMKYFEKNATDLSQADYIGAGAGLGVGMAYRDINKRKDLIKYMRDLSLKHHGPAKTKALLGIGLGARALGFVGLGAATGALIAPSKKNHEKKAAKKSSKTEAAIATGAAGGAGAYVGVRGGEALAKQHGKLIAEELFNSKSWKNTPPAFKKVLVNSAIAKQLKASKGFKRIGAITGGILGAGAASKYFLNKEI